jgi:uncharacterized protein YdiU (UPF0061 family)
LKQITDHRREYNKTYGKKWYYEHKDQPEYQAKRKIQRKNYREKHKEEEKAYRRKRYRERIIDEKKYKKEHRELYRNANKKYSLKNPKIKPAQEKALKISLAEFCELCPEDDKRVAVERHHPDYDYPLIIVSCCIECHHLQQTNR